MKKNFIVIISLVLIQINSYCQTSRYSTPPRMTTPSDLGLGNVTKALQQANARAEASYNDIQPLIDLNIEILQDKIKQGCDNRIVDFYNENINRLSSRKYNYNSPQDASNLKRELGSLRSALISFDCRNTIPSNSNLTPASPSANDENFNAQGVVSSATYIWTSHELYKANVVQEIKKDASVTIVGRNTYANNVFYKVILSNGKTGYINAKYLWIK